ncbi:hypothetical protein [Bacillus sp. SH5-2]|nr:hypothetical protein [Bacillus sp. SH5-2]
MNTNKGFYSYSYRLGCALAYRLGCALAIVNCNIHEKINGE